MSDKIELMRLCGFYRAIFRVLANQNRGHSRVMFFFFFFKLFIFPFLYTGATVSGGVREANPPPPPIRNLTVFIIHSMMSTNC